MTGTPARDALRHILVDYYANADLLDHEVVDLTVEALLCPDEHPTVIAALVEAGWRPSDEELRLMGGRHRYTGDGMLTYIDLGWHFPSSEVQRP